MAETKAAYTHVGPGLPPLYGARAMREGVKTGNHISRCR